MAPGTKIKVTLARKGEIKTLTLTLGKMPNEQQAKADTSDEMSAGDRRVSGSISPRPRMLPVQVIKVSRWSASTPMVLPPNAASRPAT